jgi:hypothetical protein
MESIKFKRPADFDFTSTKSPIAFRQMEAGYV